MPNKKAGSAFVISLAVTAAIVTIVASVRLQRGRCRQSKD